MKCLLPASALSTRLHLQKRTPTTKARLRVGFPKRFAFANSAASPNLLIAIEWPSLLKGRSAISFFNVKTYEGFGFVWGHARIVVIAAQQVNPTFFRTMRRTATCNRALLDRCIRAANSCALFYAMLANLAASAANLRLKVRCSEHKLDACLANLRVVQRQANSTPFGVFHAHLQVKLLLSFANQHVDGHLSPRCDRRFAGVAKNVQPLEELGGTRRVFAVRSNHNYDHLRSSFVASCTFCTSATYLHCGNHAAFGSIPAKAVEAGGAKGVSNCGHVSGRQKVSKRSCSVPNR